MGSWAQLGDGFQPRGGVLPGGGTPEARHSKVTEAFSSTALFSGPGSMLGGTRGDKESPIFGGCGLGGTPPSHPWCPSLAFPKGLGNKSPRWLMSPEGGTLLLNPHKNKDSGLQSLWQGPNGDSPSAQHRGDRQQPA